MRPSVSLGLSQSSLETFFPWRCRSNCCSWASVGASSSAFEVTDEIHLKEDARRDRTPPDRARVVRSTESLDERVGVVLGKKLVQCSVERVTGRLRHVRGRDERLQLPTVSASLAVRGKSLPWPFSTWATPKKAKVFWGRRSPFPAAADFIHSRLEPWVPPWRAGLCGCRWPQFSAIQAAVKPCFSTGC
jgi:hypothetical protein